MEYRKVYFRIRSRYQFDSGWPAETDAAKFMKKAAACSRVRAGIYSPVGTAHLIPLRKAGRSYTASDEL